MTYFLHILVLIDIYAILAVSLNLLAGCTGLLSVAHAAFYGLGAYAGALVAIHWGLAFPLDLIVAAGFVALIALIVAVPLLRIRGDYFVLATFAFQMIVFDVLNNSTDITNGPMGISGIPQPTILGHLVASSWAFLGLFTVVALLLVMFLLRLDSRPFGKVIRGIREDELLAETLGRDARREKIIAFVVSSAVAAAAGALYGRYISYIAPTNFTIYESIFLLAIVIIGGAGNLIGSVTGAALLVAIPEALRFVGIPSSAAANVRQILYGLLLAVLMLVRPRGMVGEYEFHDQ
jgi:branched-chain amino acid transport system permease protein